LTARAYDVRPRVTTGPRHDDDNTRDASPGRTAEARAVKRPLPRGRQRSARFAELAEPSCRAGENEASVCGARRASVVRPGAFTDVDAGAAVAKPSTQ